jgi:hypothetical protein
LDHLVAVVMAWIEAELIAHPIRRTDHQSNTARSTRQD